MEIERSNVPGYDATVLTQLAEHERFVLRNPQDRRDLVLVDTVIAFDRGSATDPRPYFVAWGTDLDGSNRRELGGKFPDPGNLPPHVRDAFAADDRIPEGPREWFGGQPIDHAPEERLGPGRAAEVRAERSRPQPTPRATPQAQPRERRHTKQPLDEETLARLRQEHNVVPFAQRERDGSRWDRKAPSAGDPFARDNRPTLAGNIGIDPAPRPQVLTFGPREQTRRPK
ncbi:MAG TPA: hypothetical protein VF062_22300 [Candidatus Limnocylindrales bacterium]